jgi:hypothetical protein
MTYEQELGEKIKKSGQDFLKKIITVFRKQKPRFIHDCKNCIFLGRHHEYDLYFCAQDFSDTVIARYSDNGPDYLSSLKMMVVSNSVLLVAKKRAIKMGLLIDYCKCSKSGLHKPISKTEHECFDCGKEIKKK